MSDMTQYNCEKHWYEEEIHLKRPNRGDKSLGITIDGGIDNPFRYPRFTAIIITRIFENGLADRDERLKLYDIILRVNTIDLTSMKHRDARDALKNSGENVQLLIRRLSPLIIDEIKLEHNGKLDISIGGGLGNEIFQKDPRIVITGINKDQTNNQLNIGDRLLQISSGNKTYDLQFVTQDIARKRIESACAESQKIKLCVGRRLPIIRVPSKRCAVHQGQYDLNDEDTIHVNQTQYIIAAAKYKNTQTQTEDLNENRRMNNATLNEECVDNRRKQPLTVLFKFDDHQRCEECSKVSNNILPHDRYTNRPPLLSVVEREQPQSHVIKFMKIEGNSYILGALFFQQQYSYTIAPTVKDLKTDQRVINKNDSRRKSIRKRRNVHRLEQKETAIGGTSAEQRTRQENQMSRRTCMNRESTANGENRRWSCNETEV